MPNKGISALMGIGGAMLILVAIYNIIFVTSAEYFEGQSVYYTMGYGFWLALFMTGGGVLLYFFFKRTRKQEQVQA